MLTFAQLLEVVHREPDVSRALRTIVEAAAGLTKSRNVLLALLDEEIGVLEMPYIVGEDVEDKSYEDLTLKAGTGDGIVGLVAATGESVLSGDVHKEPHYRKLFSTTRSEMAVPIRNAEDRILGVLNLESDQLDAYGPKDDETAYGLAALIAIVLSREESRQREEALIQIGSALDNSLTEEALIQQLIHVASDVLRFQAASVFLLDTTTDRFVLRGSVGRLKDRIGEISYGRGEGCTGWVCDSGQPILLNEPLKDARWIGRHVEFTSEQVASFLCVPIVSRNKSVGAIRVLRRVSDNKYLDNRFTDNDLRLLEAIADQVSSGLENLRNLEKTVRSERMIAWGELSAKSSHMIGNRVFALKGDVNELRHLLNDKNVNVDTLKELQSSLEINLTRVEEILQDFRDFVSATQLNRTPSDLNQLVKETASEIFPRRSPYHLDLSLDPNLGAIDMDAKKLRRAVSELMENSMNWMESGQLRVATSLVPKETYAITRRSRVKKWARIEVQDSGPGVDEAKKPRIFEPFFSGRVKGMGLGLSIVKGIVDAHGGEVFEAGEPGAGANFVILLPATDRP